MFLYILIGYLTYCSNVLAFPTTIVPNDTFPEILSFLQEPNASLAALSAISVDPAGDCNCNKRSALNIFWSCVSTLFLCTWTIVHLNIPASDEERWRILWRRLRTMYWCIILPEIVASWAIRQFIGARHIFKKYKDTHVDWSMKHAHFLQMGGFYLNSKEYTGVLYPEKFDELLSQNIIVFPTVKEADIEDKSKADGLSKLIVLTQTLWFVTQCIGRLAQGLELAKLEVTTLAVISSTFILSIMWWDKPLDVRRPIYLGGSNNYHAVQELSECTTNTQTNTDTNTNKSSDAITDAGDDMPRSSISEDSASIITSVYAKSRLLYRSSLDYLVQFLQTAFAGFHSIYTAIRASVIESLQTQGVVATVYNILYSWPLATQISKFLALDGPEDSVQRSKRVKSYYAVSTDNNGIIFEELHVPCGVIFGLIHCIAWNSHFTSVLEKFLWRFSIGIMLMSVFGLQVAIHVTGKYGVRFDGESFPGVLWAGFSVMIYLVARHCLLVGAMVSIRALPPSVLETVPWLNFLPHL